MENLFKNNDYINFLSGVKERIHKAQYEAFKVVNKELIVLYWDIGRMIVERQKTFSWGKAVVENLANDLQKEFPGIQGFSAQNLWRMKQFYQTYNGNKKLSPMVREIGWTHNVVIMMNCKDNAAREFYITMSKKFGWTKNVLIHQIENQAYEKTLLNQTNFDKTISAKIRNQAKLAVKDEYTFDFLELSEEHLENELERALINNIRKFLLEMGGYFCFVSNQYRIEIDGEEFFIDLLLYHRKLRCFVAVELKIGAFKAEYAGKMNFYLSVLNDRSKLEEESPAIGIIICRTKNRTVVEYALKDMNKPIGVATYKLMSDVPQKLAKYLPSKKDLLRSVKELRK